MGSYTYYYLWRTHMVLASLTLFVCDCVFSGCAK